MVAYHCDPGDCDLSENAVEFSTLLDEIRIECIPPENLRTSQTWMKPKKRKRCQLAYTLTCYHFILKNIY